jgi:hypothetical protein
MGNVSSMTPATTLDSGRTAATNSASSTANPWTPGANVTTWSLPNKPQQPLVQTSQSFSTQQGQIFDDFASGIVVFLGPGTVNTSGTAVTYVSGPVFNTSWPSGFQVIIAGVTYKVSSVASTTSMTLQSSAGTQSGASIVVDVALMSDLEGSPANTD